jgi:hypothetical protein
VPVWRIKSESFPQIAQLEAFGGWFSTKIGAAANFLFCNSPFFSERLPCAKEARRSRVSHVAGTNEGKLL